MTVPIACVPGAIPAPERESHFMLARELFETVALERRDEPDGVSVRFPAEALPELARWMANERACCPFLTFTLRVGAGEEVAWLTMSGPDGTAEFLRRELPEPRRRDV